MKALFCLSSVTTCLTYFHSAKLTQEAELITNNRLIQVNHHHHVYTGRDLENESKVILCNIYMRLLGEVIHCHGIRYHQHAEDAPLHICFWGGCDLSMGQHKLRLNNTWVVWIHSPPPISEDLSTSLLDVLPQMQQTCNLGLMPKSRLKGRWHLWPDCALMTHFPGLGGTTQGYSWLAYCNTPYRNKFWRPFRGSRIWRHKQFWVGLPG